MSDTDDVVVRLRELHRHTAGDAADEIESLRRRVKELESMRPAGLPLPAAPEEQQ